MFILKHIIQKEREGVFYMNKIVVTSYQKKEKNSCYKKDKRKAPTLNLNKRKNKPIPRFHFPPQCC